MAAIRAPSHGWSQPNGGQAQPPSVASRPPAEVADFAGRAAGGGRDPGVRDEGDRGARGIWFETRADVLEFTEVAWNRQRHQAGFGHLTPVEYDSVSKIRGSPPKRSLLNDLEGPDICAAHANQLVQRSLVRPEDIESFLSQPSPNNLGRSS